MEKISHLPWPEIVFGSSDSAISQAIRRAVKAGELKKLAPRLYTPNLKDAPADVIKRNLYHILGAFFPGAILSYRSALEGGPSKEGILVLTYKYTKSWTLPGLKVRLIQGPGPQEGDSPFVGHLFFASRERALLENLQSSRNRGSDSKTMSREFIEHYLDKLCRSYGIEELNKIRDNARILAKKMLLNNEFAILDKMIGALLGTQEVHNLRTEVALARAAGSPYDTARIELFAKLAAILQTTPLASPQAPLLSEDGLRNLAFFESYFSNYIEGTEFEIEEAADIVFRGKLTPYRPEDAHDILGTFKILSNLNEMYRIPTSAETLFELLKTRHAFFMAPRKDKEPGQFKQKVNRAGNTVFVHPELVKGTLSKAFELYQSLSLGIKRAIFIMFVIAETHPFLDGNGRIARIMMNAELVHAEQSRIIIPTVFREDYLLTLRRLTREGDPNPYIRMLQRAQSFTASLDFSEYQHCLEQLRKCNAFLEPHEGKLKF